MNLSRIGTLQVVLHTLTSDYHSTYNYRELGIMLSETQALTWELTAPVDLVSRPTLCLSSAGSEQKVSLCSE